ncbi:alpha/beta-hydrolase [Wolfiporia cocos MD-104 SS10]|uniref:Alpha/beta-hydrolase n=1 Tax=Wolfiporia cocos (strain MD-104) TaxID=742152 RepID=A0A2H3JQZ2_WOLCO|nr:alpha/beta-hydrolase [Wolfiporia cocos MD-104 SS10]
MVHELRRQPFRSLYLFLQVAITLAVRIPFWTLSHLYRRPRPSWSLFTTLGTFTLRLFSEFGPIAEKVGPVRFWPDHRAILEGPGVKGVWLSPNSSCILGAIKEWAAAASVQSTRIPGYWIDKPGSNTQVGDEPSPDEKVILYLHGGGFISESAHPSSILSTTPRSILSHCPSSGAKRALAVEYRLCELSPVYTNPFPAALIDAITGYCYLVMEVGFKPENIIFVGDSAGGNLALALARYLADNSAELALAMGRSTDGRPLDYQMILLSPWSDLGTSHETPESALLNNNHDFLVDVRTGLFAHARRAYAGPLGFSATDANPYLSPASKFVNASFSGFPRTFIELGDAERFLDMCRSLRDAMVRDMGPDRVGYYEAPDAVHDHLVLPIKASAKREALRAIEDWFADAK